MSEQLCDELEDAQKRLKNVEALIPKGFYADRTLEFRVERVIDNWKRCVKVLTDREEREVQISEQYFLETGKDFYDLPPVMQKQLIEGRCIT